MATIISRLYKDTAAAQAVVAALRGQGYPADTIDLIAGGDGSVIDQIRATGVGPGSAAAYADRIATGKALVVARVGFTPIGAARNAMQIVDSFDPLHVAGAVADDYVEDPLRNDLLLSILTTHPHMLSPDLTATTGRRYGLVSDAFGIRVLSPNRPHRSAMRGGGHMSTKILPFPLLTKRRQHKSAIHGGGTPFSTMLGLPLVARRR
jgi:hypothetical protein